MQLVNFRVTLEKKTRGRRWFMVILHKHILEYLNECLPIHFYILTYKTRYLLWKCEMILDSSYSNAGILNAVHSISRIFDEHLSFQKFISAYKCAFIVLFFKEGLRYLWIRNSEALLIYSISHGKMSFLNQIIIMYDYILII